MQASTGPAGPPTRSPVALEPTVVLDEHSNYLNHLNQLRRINSGDDLTDRPGYGLYLIRIPVTLSPGPRSRRGKGAIITVSAKSIMTKHTLRNALRNAVINETVTNLTQAIVNRSGSDRRPGSRPRRGNVLAARRSRIPSSTTAAENIALLRSEAEHQLAGELGDEPHHRSARVAEWLERELQSSYHLFEEAATPLEDRRSSPRHAIRSKSWETRYSSAISRESPRCSPARTATRSSSRPQPENRQRPTSPSSSADESSSILSFALRIQAAGLNRRLKQDMADQDPELKRDVLKQISFFEPEPI